MLLLVLNKDTPTRNPFEFELMWLIDDSLIRTIEKWWEKANIIDSRLYKVV